MLLVMEFRQASNEGLEVDSRIDAINCRLTMLADSTGVPSESVANLTGVRESSFNLRDETLKLIHVSKNQCDLTVSD
jgi:hypothetical protein